MADEKDLPSGGEHASVAASNTGPVTKSTLVSDLTTLGVSTSMVLIVHTSMSRLGWIAGGAQAVIESLLGILGNSGTLVMPTHSAHLSEPSNWRNPPVPKHWWPILRRELPGFDPAVTPTRDMGVVAETFRSMPSVRRSDHPQGSFAALGPRAGLITGEHPVDCLFGEESPLGRLYDLDAHVLLLGVGHGNNTSMHLAEYRANFPAKRVHAEGAPVVIAGERRWVEFEDLAVDDDDFERIGDEFAADTGLERRSAVGIGEARLMRMRDIVDYAVDWMESHR